MSASGRLPNEPSDAPQYAYENGHAWIPNAFGVGDPAKCGFCDSYHALADGAPARADAPRLADAADNVLKVAQYIGLYPESAFVSRDALDNLRAALSAERESPEGPKVTKEWCLEMALREGDLEVGAGPRHDYLVHETIEALVRCPLCAEQVRDALNRCAR